MRVNYGGIDGENTDSNSDSNDLYIEHGEKQLRKTLYLTLVYFWKLLILNNTLQFLINVMRKGALQKFLSRNLKRA